MKADLAMFLEFSNGGKIIKQRNYDCYHPIQFANVEVEIQPREDETK